MTPRLSSRRNKATSRIQRGQAPSNQTVSLAASAEASPSFAASMVGGVFKEIGSDPGLFLLCVAALRLPEGARLNAARYVPLNTRGQPFPVPACDARISCSIPYPSNVEQRSIAASSCFVLFERGVAECASLIPWRPGKGFRSVNVVQL